MVPLTVNREIAWPLMG